MLLSELDPVNKRLSHLKSLYIYIYTLHIYIYIYIYIHTHTHTLMLNKLCYLGNMSYVLIYTHTYMASLVAQTVKNLYAMQETVV